jgi:outer membrane protein OmpA-like peptidoglycan-associated protein
MPRAYRLLGAALALATSVSLSAAAWAAESGLMQNPSAADIVNALKSGQAAKMRGIAPTTGAAPSAAGAQAQPSASLDIKFAFNSAKLEPEAETTLAELAKALKSPELAKSSIAIVGHTDAKGAAAYNQKLSLRRAMAVKMYLAKQGGIAAGRLDAQGKGQSGLLDPKNPTSEVNRRVEIINLGA